MTVVYAPHSPDRTRKCKHPWREAGLANHHDDKVDSDQKVVNEELSLLPGVGGGTMLKLLGAFTPSNVEGLAAVIDSRWVPREQKMLKRYLPRVRYHLVY